MTRYNVLKSVTKLKHELDRDGYLTKARITKKRSQIGGKSFSRGHLYKLLCNPVYIGKTVHKGVIYDGQHDPTIELELWKKVQDGLKDNAPKRKRAINIASNSLLTGMIYDGSGDRLSPVHSKKPNGRRYRYYISARLSKGEIDDGTALRLPAQQIEGHVIKRLTTLLSNTALLLETTGCSRMSPHQITKLKEQASGARKQLSSSCNETQRTALIDLIERVTISPTELTLELRKQALLPQSILSKIAGNKDDTVTLSYPLQMKRRGVETKLIIGGQTIGDPNLELVKLIAMARDWYEGLKTGEYSSQLDIASKYKLDGADVSRILNLAFLSPKIISAVISGNQSPDMTVLSLKMAAGKLPTCWNEQAVLLGFAA